MPIELSGNPPDPWSPYVYGDPVDAPIDVREPSTLRRWRLLCVIISKLGPSPDYDELFWNGSSFVELADAGIPGVNDKPTTPPAGAIVMSRVQYGLWRGTVPWSVMGAGTYRVRPYYDQPATDAYYYFNPNIQGNKLLISGARSENPDGVSGVGSNFGGTDALRVVDPQGNPISGVSIIATVTPAGNNYVYTRATATTGSDGRWAFPVVLQPNTEHRLTFTHLGYVMGSTTITTGDAN